MKKILFAALGGLVVLGSCGDDGNNKAIDAAVTDGAKPIDAKIADAAPPTPVSVSVINDGSAVGSATVYFLNADGTTAGEALTDANGSASHTVGSGGSVTVVVQAPTPTAATTGVFSLRTVEGVKPGDQLAFVSGDVEVANTGVQITIGAETGATTYSVTSTCTEPGANITGMTPGSADDITLGNEGSACGTADILVYASGSGVDATAADLAVAVTANGDISTAAATYVNRTTTTPTYTDVPAGIDGLSFTQVAHTSHGVLDEVDEEGAVTGGSATLAAVKRAVITGSTQITETEFEGSFSGNTIVENGAALSTYSLDVGANTQPQFSALPTFSVANHAVSWTESATGSATPVVQIAEIEYGRGSGGLPGSVGCRGGARRADHHVPRFADRCRVLQPDGYRHGCSEQAHHREAAGRLRLGAPAGVRDLRPGPTRVASGGQGGPPAVPN